MIQEEYTNSINNDRKRQKNIILKLTVNILELTYKINPVFKKSLMFKPSRTLTQPSEPSTNSGYDNIMRDYILRVNEWIGDIKRYEILEYMGRGAFGQVAKCRQIGSDMLVAIKITKRDPLFLQQSLREIKFLKMLNQYSDNKDRILQLHDWFLFRGHQCTVVELLSTNILQFFTLLSEKPRLTMHHIQYIAKQILETLAILKKSNVIHADIKPDNILFKRLGDTYNIMLVDYGSARYPDEPLNYPVQSSRYRAPEVILRIKYSFPIDIWSFGCFVAELFLGEGLFPNVDEIAIFHMMISLLQCYPPEEMLYSIYQSPNSFEAGTVDKLKSAKSILDEDLSQYSLEERIMKARSDDTLMTNKESIGNLVDFLRKILTFDPNKRLTPDEALKHAFMQTDYSKMKKAIKITTKPIVGKKRAFNDVQTAPKPLKSILKTRKPISND